MVHFPYSLEFLHDMDPTGISMPTTHAHPYHELYFLLSGRRRYFIRHTIYDVVPGNLVFIPKEYLHRTVTFGNNGFDRYVVYFSEQDHEAFINAIGQPAFDGLMHSGCVHFPTGITRQLQQTLKQLEQEMAAPGMYTKAVASHLLQDILLTALRHGVKTEPFHGESADKIQQVARHINEHYAEPLSLADAARLAHMEHTYFSKRFKALTGLGFHEYLAQTRLRQAERLLRDSRLSLSEIAECCGFSNSNYFGDVFRRWKGESPSAYRRSIQPDSPPELW